MKTLDAPRAAARRTTTKRTVILRASLARRIPFHFDREMPASSSLSFHRKPRILTGTRAKTKIAATRTKQTTEKFLTGTDSQFYRPRFLVAVSASALACSRIRVLPSRFALRPRPMAVKAPATRHDRRLPFVD